LQGFWIFAEAFHPDLQYLREIFIISQAGSGAGGLALYLLCWV